MSVSGVDADDASEVRRQGKTSQPRNLFGHLPLSGAPVVAPRTHSRLIPFSYPTFSSELSAVEPDTKTPKTPETRPSVIKTLLIPLQNSPIA